MRLKTMCKSLGLCSEMEPGKSEESHYSRKMHMYISRSCKVGWMNGMLGSVAAAVKAGVRIST